MASDYPTSVDSFTTKRDDIDFVVASHVNKLQDAVIATQTFVGVSADGNLVKEDATQTLTNKTLTTPTLSGDTSMGATDNFTPGGSDPWRTVDLAPGFLKPTTTDGCADSTQTEAATNDIDYDYLAFDNSSDENAYVNFQMPDSWNGGVIQFRYIWTTSSGSASETVAFELSGRSYADGDAIDQAVGTAVEVSDTWQADGDVHISAWSGNVTLAGGPAAGEWVHLELMRDVSEDDLGGDALIMMLQIRYRQAQFTD